MDSWVLGSKCEKNFRLHTSNYPALKGCASDYIRLYQLTRTPGHNVFIPSRVLKLAETTLCIKRDLSKIRY